MRYPHLRILVWLVALIALSTPTQAQETLTTAQLRAKGVETGSLQPIVFSHDSKTVACFDHAPFEEKKEGTFFRLWFFQVQPDGRFGDVRSVKLSLKNLQQGEFTPDDDQFVVLGNRGTTFLTVDLKDLSVHDLMVPEWGKAGFRADPPVLWSEDGKLFTLGHLYDRERFVEPSTVATVKPNAEEGSRFERGPNISALEKGLERLWFTNYGSDHSAFFGQKYPQLTIVSYWDGQNVREIDRAWKFSGFWSQAGKLLYSRRTAEGADNDLVVYNSADDHLEVVESSPEDYRYLFLSRDGDTLLFSRLIPQQERLIPYYAHKSQGWKSTPVLNDRQGRPSTIPPGWMRLSSDGKWLCYVGASGITLYPLP